MKRPTPQRAERAIQCLQRATRLETRRAFDRTQSQFDKADARLERAKGETLLARPPDLHGDPSLDASDQRASLAQRAGVLVPALEVSDVTATSRSRW